MNSPTRNHNLQKQHIMLLMKMNAFDKKIDDAGFEEEIEKELNEFSQNSNLTHVIRRNTPVWNSMMSNLRKTFSLPISTHVCILKPENMTGKQKEQYDKGINMIKKSIFEFKKKKTFSTESIRGKTSRLTARDKKKFMNKTIDTKKEKKNFEDFKKWLTSMDNDSISNKRPSKEYQSKKTNSSVPKLPIDQKRRTAKEIVDKALKHVRTRKINPKP